jgi:hypothetical protein
MHSGTDGKREETSTSIDLGVAFPGDVLNRFVVASHNFLNQSAWILFPENEQQHPRAKEQDARDKKQGVL